MLSINEVFHIFEELTPKYIMIKDDEIIYEHEKNKYSFTNSFKENNIFAYFIKKIREENRAIGSKFYKKLQNREEISYFRLTLGGYYYNVIAEPMKNHSNDRIIKMIKGDVNTLHEIDIYLNSYKEINQKKGVR